jgi:hypothetical protein
MSDLTTEDLISMRITAADRKLILDKTREQFVSGE